MDLTVRIEPLGHTQIEIAYPLVRAIATDLTLEHWRGYASAMITPEGPQRRGIMGAWSSAGYLHGMFGYVIAPDLVLGRLLQIENFVAMDIRGSGRTANALVDAVRALAGSEGCVAVQALVPPVFAALFDQRDLVPLLRAPEGRTILRRRWLVSRDTAADPARGGR